VASFAASATAAIGVQRLPIPTLAFMRHSWRSFQCGFAVRAGCPSLEGAQAQTAIMRSILCIPPSAPRNRGRRAMIPAYQAEIVLCPRFPYYRLYGCSAIQCPAMSSRRQIHTASCSST
jgi:hypothetical protein